MVLGAVLLVIFACMMFAFGLAGMCTMHLNMMSRMIAHARARDLAESAMAIAIAQALEDPKFGATPSDPNSSVVLLDQGGTLTSLGTIAGVRVPNAGVRGEALLSFDATGAGALGIPWSVNNISQSSSVVGWDGRTIPAHALHVVALALEGTEQQAVESVVSMPPFPFALAASGVLTSTGTLMAASVPGIGPVCPYSLNAACLGPASVGSNSAGSPAIAMGAATIGGDVDAVGCIRVSACTNIRGALSSHHAPIPLPFIYVPGQFTELCEYPNVQTITSATGPLTGLSQSGNLTVAGDLVLNQAVLYVKGSLKVGGGIKGIGAVFVQGSAEVDGCSTLSTSDVCALVAMGPITLKGTSQGSSYFQGIVYSSDSITASNVTVLGNMLANAAPMPTACAPGCRPPPCAPASGSGNICLQNVSVISSVQTTTVTSQAPVSVVAFGSQMGMGAGTATLSMFLGSEGSNCAGFLCLGCGTVGGRPNPLGQSFPRCLDLQVQGIPPCAPTQVHLSGHVTVHRGTISHIFGTGCACFCINSTWHYPMPAACMHQFLARCIAPIIQARQEALLNCLFGGPPCVIACVEQHAPQVQLQAIDIVQYHTTCSYTTQQVLCSAGYMFRLDLNQFLGLENQMRVLYWAPLDTARLRGP
ncbi:MAG TPA: hypothetical protein VGO93_31980 [Candidatus Xenobia bacterium]|jgi:hypothetical protein